MLLLNHCTVAPNVHFHSLNPHLDLTGYPCYISAAWLETCRPSTQLVNKSRPTFSSPCPKTGQHIVFEELPLTCKAELLVQRTATKLARGQNHIFLNSLYSLWMLLVQVIGVLLPILRIGENYCPASTSQKHRPPIGFDSAPLRPRLPEKPDKHSQRGAGTLWQWRFFLFTPCWCDK